MHSVSTQRPNLESYLFFVVCRLPPNRRLASEGSEDVEAHLISPHSGSAGALPQSSSQQSGLVSDSEAFGTPRSDVESIATSAGLSPRSIRTPQGRSRARGMDFGGMQDGVELRSLEASRRGSLERL